MSDGEDVAFFGAGMLGSGFVEAMAARGTRVRVWNRTFEKAKLLERFGAIAVRDAAEAARGAQRIHLCLRDDAAVDETLVAALPGISRDALIVDHTTTSPRGVVARVDRMADNGFDFLHAPVFMGPPQAAKAIGLMLASGARTLFDRARPHLERMTGEVWYLGERTDKAALFKLMGNAMILAVVGGMNDMFSIAEANALDRREAFQLFEKYHPEGQISGRGKRMSEDDYEATWSLDMARKDARLMVAAADGRDLPVVAAVEREAGAQSERGFGAKDLAALALR